jgi:hypothetical protein
MEHFIYEFFETSSGNEGIRPSKSVNRSILFEITCRDPTPSFPLEKEASPKPLRR